MSAWFYKFTLLNGFIKRALFYKIHRIILTYQMFNFIIDFRHISLEALLRKHTLPLFYNCVKDFAVFQPE